MQFGEFFLLLAFEFVQVQLFNYPFPVPILFFLNHPDRFDGLFLKGNWEIDLWDLL